MAAAIAAKQSNPTNTTATNHHSTTAQPTSAASNALMATAIQKSSNNNPIVDQQRNNAMAMAVANALQRSNDFSTGNFGALQSSLAQQMSKMAQQNPQSQGAAMYPGSALLASTAFKPFGNGFFSNGSSDALDQLWLSTVLGGGAGGGGAGGGGGVAQLRLNMSQFAQPNVFAAALAASVSPHPQSTPSGIGAVQQLLLQHQQMSAAAAAAQTQLNDTAEVIFFQDFFKQISTL